MIRSLAFLLFSLFSISGYAHNRGMSYSHWQVEDEQVWVRARVASLELTRLGLDPRFTPNYAAESGARLSQDLQLWQGQTRCLASDITAALRGDGWLEAQWRLACPASPNLTVVTRLFETVAPSHLHWVEIERPGYPAFRQALHFGEPLLMLPSAAAVPSGWRAYIAEGFRHILGGYDHIAFLVGLALLAGSWRQLAVLATGFTIAHSVTLAAAIFAWIKIKPPQIEAIIGFSIALVALESFWQHSAKGLTYPLMLVAVLSLLMFSTWGVAGLPALLAFLMLLTVSYFVLLQLSDRPWRWRLVLTMVFGLVHGFGFSGALAELDLAPSAVVPTLLGFNLGVELGQGLILLLLWPLLQWLRRCPKREAQFVAATSTALLALGTFWLTRRTLFL